MTNKSPASIRARLKNLADAEKQDFNLVLTRFGLERLLYRLSTSRHAGNYLLKGALLFSIWYAEPMRPTRDADLLGFGDDDVATAVAAFKEICAIRVEDGIIFDTDSVKAAAIRKDAGYGGVRVDLLGNLDGARIALQVDIGFGDAVTPGPEQVRYPVLLEDLPAPRLRAYPKYTVIAEKLHAICLLGIANSRMKDYFDLRMLLNDNELDATALVAAVRATFHRRELKIPTALPIGLSDAFGADAPKQKQWDAFLRKGRLAAPSLSQTVTEVRTQLVRSGVLKVSS
jgi:hypothetical protein